MSGIFERLEKLDWFRDRNIPIKERVIKLIGTVSSLNPNPDLQKALDDVKNEESQFINAYRELSDEIKQSLDKVLYRINELKLEALRIDIELLKQQEKLDKYCSLYSVLPPVKDNLSALEYKDFRDKYERGNVIVSELSTLNIEALNLMEVQRILDSSFSYEIIEIRCFAEQLNEIMSSFRNKRTPELVEECRKRFNSLDELKFMVRERERSFEEMKKHLEISRLETKIVDKYDTFANNCLSDGISIGISKNLFVYKK
ncbi:hypothetical protein MHC_05735 [Mycoplasma haemocanis str. Illinois]|uniref:Uncharacterized protein n=1 Tax=Mycoplasma haemocanis (strain Illinois) TaxID=1111676 RepID=H6N8M8_MYCHN|nr:hypothetical protein [Mycoplasma haemocanis]AEW46000.1 hypothetical protein MHC_05735 [Mycoplasma haemocanis str. Illinois]